MLGASNSNFGGLIGHPGLQMTSEVKFDIRNQLMGINDLSSHVFPASEYLYGLNDTPEDKWLPLTSHLSIESLT